MTSWGSKLKYCPAGSHPPKALQMTCPLIFSPTFHLIPPASFNECIVQRLCGGCLTEMENYPTTPVRQPSTSQDTEDVGPITIACITYQCVWESCSFSLYYYFQTENENYNPDPECCTWLQWGSNPRTCLIYLCTGPASSKKRWTQQTLK